MFHPTTKFIYVIGNYCHAQSFSLYSYLMISFPYSFIYKEAYDFPNADIQVSVHSSETEYVCLHAKMVNPYYISFSFYSFLLSNV